MTPEMYEVFLKAIILVGMAKSVVDSFVKAKDKVYDIIPEASETRLRVLKLGAILGLSIAYLALYVMGAILIVKA